MPRIKTDVVKDGMVVATDVKNIDNMLLIPAGCVLTDRQIGILQAWGVGEIDVEASHALEDADPLATLPSDVVARMAAEVRGRFWQPDDTNPVFAEIVKVMLQRHARRAGGK